MRYNVAQSQSMSEVFRSRERTENTFYDYAFNVYVPDTHAVVYDATSESMVYADRLTIDEALSFWEDWGPMLEAWQREKTRAERTREQSLKAIAEIRGTLHESQNENANLNDALRYVATFLGENARKHSIDNSLCENYERFLNNVIRREINNPEDDYLRYNDAYKDALQNFYRYATRTRAASFTIGVSGNGYTTGDGRNTVTERSTYEMSTENSTSVLSYEDAHTANKYAETNGWTRGHEAFATEDNQRPSNPSDGDQYDGYTYCSDCDAWHEND